MMPASAIKARSGARFVCSVLKPPPGAVRCAQLAALLRDLPSRLRTAVFAPRRDLPRRVLDAGVLQYKKPPACAGGFRSFDGAELTG
jgi:hypothetical protein